MIEAMYDEHIPELYLPKKAKRDTHKKNWTPEMIQALYEKFPVTYNKVLASELKVSWRTLVRKARELGIYKEPGFLETRRVEIEKMANANKPSNPMKGVKGWSVPGGESYRFTRGHIPAMATDPSLVKRVHETRNETIRRDRIRMKLGLSRLTKINHRII